MKKNIDLSGKISVVIGGSGSIGQEISLELFKSGARVIIADLNKPHSPKITGLIKIKKIFFIQTDLKNEESVKSLSDFVLAKFKGVDILVLAHGVQLRKPFYDFSLNEWENVIDVNLTGTFLACKYLTRSMIERGYGKVIGITSLTSEFGIRNISAYAASKGGMQQFLKTVAVELAKYNINVNMIAPGRIKTKMTEKLLKNKVIRESNLGCIPMKRFGKPADIIGAVLFLSSSASDYITGHSIYIDGGWSIGLGNPKD